MSNLNISDFEDNTDIAVIGMSGRFPGATNVNEFWRNLREGVESITQFTDAELRQAGVDSAALSDPNYVKAGAILEDIDRFDAAFFGLTPREAQLMDPQQRLFLEEAWNAIESAGYNSSAYRGTIGVFAGIGWSTYYLNNLSPNQQLLESVGQMPVVLGNEKDSLATRVAYLFDLTGPCYTLQTYCSTSLVAVNTACENLLSGTCDMALAGGALVTIPQKAGYYYQEGGIASPDARCRAFDAKAKGAPLGNGVAIVLLKRLADAVADGDTIHAVIKGWAVNNDGALRVGYTAPGVRGQAGVILEALANAEVNAESISYFEAHGTGTALGDAVEFQAMAKAFGEHTNKKNFCAIGSVKTNVGHLDRAAGVTGLIKTVLALKHQLIPPSLNYDEPNPEIDFSKTPFYVNTELREWTTSNGSPLRAGVSSFGIGGTNAHVILEQAPEILFSEPQRPYQLLLLSAKTDTTLDAAIKNLQRYLKEQPINTAQQRMMADVAYTLQVGRQHFEHRCMVVAQDYGKTLTALSNPACLSHQVTQERPITFMFSGVGDHYVNMTRDLYQVEPVFREAVDQCCEILQPVLEIDLRTLLYPADNVPESNVSSGMNLRQMLGRSDAQPQSTRLNRTDMAQPAVFVIEYGISQLLQSWGIVPNALIGYSLGEYVAACVAGVLDLKDALTLVAKRAQLIQHLPTGSMLAIPISEAEVKPYLKHDICLAISLDKTCVLAGPTEAIVQLQESLTSQNIAARQLETTHAFHSTMMEPIVAEFTTLLRSISLKPPQIPYLSNVTGDWITDDEATDPNYWTKHLCQTVRFGEGLGHLLTNSERVLIEIGAGQALGSFVKQHPTCQREQWPRILSTLRYVYEHRSDVALMLETLGQLWLAGVSIDWHGFYGEEHRQRIPLPTYPFERQRYWIDPPALTSSSPKEQATSKKSDIADWFYVPEWEETANPTAQNQTTEKWLIFQDEFGWGTHLAEQLLKLGANVIRVQVGNQFAQIADDLYSLRPEVSNDYDLLFLALKKATRVPTQIAHAWSITTPSSQNLGSGGIDAFNAAQKLGFYSLIYLGQAIGKQVPLESIHLTVLSNEIQPVGDTPISPEKATILGPCRVIPQEYQHIRCRVLDIDGQPDIEASIESLAADLTSVESDVVVAYRDARRYVQTFKPLRLTEMPTNAQLRPGGVYLITGGLGTVGLTLAKYLAQRVQAKLVLISRSGLPERESWATLLEKNDPACRQIRQIQAIETLGAEVLIMAADVANEKQMGAVIERTYERFGTLHGVIHGAGLTNPNSFQAVQMMEPAVCEAHFLPKVHGLYVLEQVLPTDSLDFCFLLSSLSCVLGGLGFAAYTAANIFMDAYVHAHQHSHAHTWTSVNWDTWKIEQEGAIAQSSTVAEFEMTLDEGAQAFALALASGKTHLVNSTGDLEARIRQWVKLEVFQKIATPLEAVARPKLTTEYVPATLDSEQRIAAIWQQVLGIEQVGIHDNFFDLGGNSLIGLQVVLNMQKEFGIQISAVALFEAPTVSTLAKYLQPDSIEKEDAIEAVLNERRRHTQHTWRDSGIAVIGMTGRFPGAKSVPQLWDNLCQGVESIARFTDEELLASGVAPELLNDPNYVKARPVLDDVDLFDALFFDYSPREAELMDPQHRLFLECAWEVLELAGYAPEKYKGLIGVFGGNNISSYLLRMAKDPQLMASMNDYQVVIGNDKDSLTTGVSYKLNLQGPSFAVQTFCSTSLVATHLACQSLLNGECDLAIAGGVSIRIPQKFGHVYSEGGMGSPDGHCRTFDAQAKGTLFGDGVGVVVLKRLKEALEDGDTIHGILKASAVNNDGSLKVGYTAPSVVGQATVVTDALGNSGIDPETIGYIEAHGTATPLGDPIEVASLTRSFRKQTDKKGFCAIGSVKTNMGHLDRAAGVTGLIKALLTVKHGIIPANLHYESPNPEIDFENSPFYVNAELSKWSGPCPRRAGVNSLGMGGTNVHVIVEEPPEFKPSGPSRSAQLLLLSARTESALEVATANLAHYLRQNPQVNLADVVYTLQLGRTTFEHRRMVVCQEITDALQALESMEPLRVLTRYQRPTNRPIVFMFPGVGDHYLQMGLQLYESEPVFCETVEQCCEVLQPYLGTKIRHLLYPEQASLTESANDSNTPSVDLRAMLRRDDRQAQSPDAEKLNQTAVVQPLVFVVEYALARLLISWGAQPQALIGYSLGEYVAACLSGVLALPDALKLVAERARMIQASEGGCMLSVCLSEEAVQPFLTDEISLAAHNAKLTCVLSGSAYAIAKLEKQLKQQGVAQQRLPTTHAFHSFLMNPLAETLTELVKNVVLNPPRIPYLSNVTGTWITAEEATDPAYWAQHMCQPVRFFEGLSEVLQESEQILVEVGPGQALGSFAKQHPTCGQEQIPLILPTMRHAYEQHSDLTFLLGTLGKLWMLGLEPDWNGFYAEESRHRIELPTYPFERQRYWVKVNQVISSPTISIENANTIEEVLSALPRKELSDWFYLPDWKQTVPYEPVSPDIETSWLLFMDKCGLGEQVAAWLTKHGQQVVTVRLGQSFTQHGDRQYMLRPQMREDYESLIAQMQQQGLIPSKIVHFWSVTNKDESLEDTLAQGLYSLMALVQALGDANLPSGELSIISSNVQSVTGMEQICPEKAAVMGPCRVVPLEYANLVSRCIDIVWPVSGNWQSKTLLTNLLGELTTSINDSNATLVALRGHQRWVETLEPLFIPQVSDNAIALRQQGVYLITGGLGGIGLAMAEHLAQTVQANLILISRSGLPSRSEWSIHLSSENETTAIGQKINRVQQLEKLLGVEVLIGTADVSNETQMREVIQQATARFGTINGVIHAAGLPAIGLTQLKTPQTVHQVLTPKIMGTLVLERVLQDIELDFLVLFSSITSQTGGGPGQIDYCAANAFLDAYAQSRVGEKRLTISINWGEWQWNAWEEGLSGYDDEMATFFRDNRKRFGISFGEGMDALSRLLKQRFSQVVVSTQDFRELVRLSQRFTAAHILQQMRQEQASQPKHQRPTLGTNYAEPSNDLEHQIATIWSNILGIVDIGINDNFFELGGNSLIGLDLIARFRKELKFDNIPANMLYEAPTVKAMAAYLDEGQEKSPVVTERLSRGEKRRAKLKQKNIQRKR